MNVLEVQNSGKELAIGTKLKPINADNTSNPSKIDKITFTMHMGHDNNFHLKTITKGLPLTIISSGTLPSWPQMPDRCRISQVGPLGCLAFETVSVRCLYLGTPSPRYLS